MDENGRDSWRIRVTYLSVIFQFCWPGVLWVHLLFQVICTLIIKASWNGVLVFSALPFFRFAPHYLCQVCTHFLSLLPLVPIAWHGNLFKYVWAGSSETKARQLFTNLKRYLNLCNSARAGKSTVKLNKKITELQWDFFDSSSCVLYRNKNDFRPLVALRITLKFDSVTLVKQAQKWLISVR